MTVLDLNVTIEGKRLGDCTMAEVAKAENAVFNLFSEGIRSVETVSRGWLWWKRKEYYAVTKHGRIGPFRSTADMVHKTWKPRDTACQS